MFQRQILQNLWVWLDASHPDLLPVPGLQWTHRLCQLQSIQVGSCPSLLGTLAMQCQPARAELGMVLWDLLAWGGLHLACPFQELLCVPSLTGLGQVWGPQGTQHRSEPFHKWSRSRMRQWGGAQAQWVGALPRP